MDRPNTSSVCANGAIKWFYRDPFRRDTIHRVRHCDTSCPPLRYIVSAIAIHRVHFMICRVIDMMFYFRAKSSDRTYRVRTMVIVCLLVGCGSPDLPEPASDAYQEAVTAFYSAVASVQSGEDLGAQQNLMLVTELAPGEPAPYYNLGLLALRQNEFEEGQQWLEQARTLAPENGSVHRLLGVMELTQGNTAEGLALLRRAIELAPEDVKARYALAQELGRSSDPAQRDEASALYAELVDLLPDNQVVLVERARLAAELDREAVVEQTADALDGFAVDWPDEVREPLNRLQAVIDNGEFDQARVQLGFLRNMLLSTRSFRDDLQEVQTPTELVGDLMTDFIKLPSPSPQLAAPDPNLSFVSEPIDNPGPTQSLIASSVDGEGRPDVLAVAGGNLHANGHVIPISGDTPHIALFDYNYDFLVDVALAGAGGIELFEQDSTGNFTALRVDEMMPAALAEMNYGGVWVADIDMEGDLDLVLSVENQPPVILRNNGDATFSRLDLFTDVTQLIDFAWADFDGDGDPDPALLDGRGELYLYRNDRMGRFLRQIVPPIFGEAVAIAVGDHDSNGLMDLATLMSNGEVHAISNEDGWVVTQLGQWDRLQGTLPQAARLFFGDMDNNGAVDIVAGAPEQSIVWLNSGTGMLDALDAGIDGFVQSIGDVNEDGRLDLVGIDASGAASQWLNSGEKDYHWVVLRPRAGQALGDQRINSFTLGGEIEVRAGMLYQKQPVQSPLVHLGLGEKERVDVARIIWPNGDIQSEFELESDQSIFTPQRLKGSCPWLFTFDGEKMRFITDFIWRSPLGLRINAQETAGVMTTEDWVKIRGEALVPRDGIYDLRITAELWETHFFDHVSLMAVDHLEGTEIYVDERFAFPPPEMKVHAVSEMQPVRKVVTDLGNEVTDIIRERDGRHLDFFGRGDYQGITRDHYIEIDLPANLPINEPLWLIAHGWVRPTDSSINVAISQGTQAPPQGIRMDVPDGAGGWRTVHENLGFPAGKTKTVLMGLSDAFIADAPKRVRLSTNLEIYWDQIGWASGVSGTEVQVKTVPLQSAELRYRGFSEVKAADRSSPEVPDYQKLVGTGARWLDLAGFYTRFGDVMPLLDEVDDRYVIMNAGDEMRFTFEALDAPPEGWRRDFVLVGDGWVKDGDYNTAFSETVLPLPMHDSPSYDTPPTTLWDDPVYQKHASDWQKYHTRYVTPERVQGALADR